MAILGGGAVSYERGSPVGRSAERVQGLGDAEMNLAVDAALGPRDLEGYLAHQKPPPHRTLQ